MLCFRACAYNYTYETIVVMFSLDSDSPAPVRRQCAGGGQVLRGSFCNVPEGLLL